MLSDPPRSRGSDGSDTLAYVQIVLGISLFGTGAIFIRLIDLPATTIVAAQGLIAVLTLIAAHVLRRPRMSLRLPCDHRLILVLGLLFAADHLLFTSGIQRTTVANLITLAYLYPVFTALLSVWILKERLQPYVLAAFAFAILGTAIILYPSLAEFRIGDLQASGMGLGVALLAATSRILVKKLDPSVPSMTVNTYKYGVIALLFSPGLAGLGGNLDLSTTLFIFGNGLLSGVFAALLVLTGVRKVEANKGAVLGYAEPVVALGLAWLVLAEQPSRFSVMGGALIFGASYLVIRGRRPTPSRPPL